MYLLRVPKTEKKLQALSSLRKVVVIVIKHQCRYGTLSFHTDHGICVVYLIIKAYHLLRYVEQKVLHKLNAPTLGREM